MPDRFTRQLQQVLVLLRLPRRSITNLRWFDEYPGSGLP